MGRNNEKNMIRNLSKNFKGMHERFKDTSPLQFELAAKLFISNLCTAYDINDLDLNQAALKAYREVSELLDERLNDKTEKNREMIHHFRLILVSFMDRFYVQAGRNYD